MAQAELALTTTTPTKAEKDYSVTAAADQEKATPLPVECFSTAVHQMAAPEVSTIQRCRSTRGAAPASQTQAAVELAATLSVFHRAPIRDSAKPLLGLLASVLSDGGNN